jgi:hypothetical protein
MVILLSFWMMLIFRHFFGWIIILLAALLGFLGLYITGRAPDMATVLIGIALLLLASVLAHYSFSLIDTVSHKLLTTPYYCNTLIAIGERKRTGRGFRHSADRADHWHSPRHDRVVRRSRGPRLRGPTKPQDAY